jgi:hypothetical protein
MPKLKTKICPHCGPDPIPISRFGKNRSRPDGLQDYCRLAANEYNKKQREKNKAHNAKRKCQIKCKRQKTSMWQCLEENVRRKVIEECLGCEVEE